MMLTNNTDGDWTKITNIDKVYEIIKGKNPINYNGRMNAIELMGYYNNNKKKLSVSKNEKCYKKIRLLYNHGG